MSHSKCIVVQRISVGIMHDEDIDHLSIISTLSYRHFVTRRSGKWAT